MITVILDRFVVVLQVLCQIQILVCLVLLELVVIVDILVALLGTMTRPLLSNDVKNG